MEKVKKMAVVAIFVLVLFGITAAHILLPDEDLSTAERRKLMQLPEITTKEIFSGKYFKDLEKYLLDQFPGRQEFRGLKANFQYKILGMKANNGIYYADDHLMKLEYPFKSGQANLALGKINGMIASHPEAGAFYYSVIPDKNYFMAAQNGYPAMNYDDILNHLSQIQGTYIDIFPLLGLNDYYRTDSHWKQDRILPVAQKLAQAMGTAVDGEDAYTLEIRENFHGVYDGQAALTVEPDVMTTMNSVVTEDAVVLDAQNKELPGVYNWEEFSNVDPYDVYLSGPEPLLTITNSHAEQDKHLILFRDSFGSSIAPLLLSGYSKVTVVDLRYITSALVSEYVDFEDADVLFLYSAAMFNAGGTFK